MRPALSLGLFALMLPLAAGAASAQESPPPALIHVAHVSERFAGTPENQGLLATALADAGVAAQHARLGAQDPSNLEAMKRHAGHIIHAIDPSRVEEGPGSGYGLHKAADYLMKHGELAGKSQGATPNVTTHSPHVAASARNTLQRADQIVALAVTIRDYVESAEEAAALFAELKAVADQLVAGVDANGDGRVGWQEGEGGLQQVQEHVNFMKQASD